MSRVLRRTRTDYRRPGVRGFLVLYAHRDGSPVQKTETAGRPWRHLTLACGVQVATRLGTVQLQWRGFGA